MNKDATRLQRQIAGLLVLLCLGLQLTCIAADDSKKTERQQTFDRELNWLNDNVSSYYDWAVTLHVRLLKDFLKYKQSKLDPVAAIDVNFAARNYKTKQFEDMKRYETFWFHREVGVGVSREMNLQLSKGTGGAIVIEDTPDCETQTRPLCNAIARLILDVHLLDCDATVVAPERICEELEADFGTFRFHPITSIRADQRGILLHVISSDRKYDKYFWFDR